MNTIITIARKEFQLALRSVTTYIVFVLFLVATGLYFSSTVFKVGLAELRGVFGIMHVIMLFYIPAITMGLISRERSNGTLELLSTLPIRLGGIVWGKFLGAVMLLKTVLFFTLVYLGLISWFGYGIDYGAVFCGYFGLILAGSAYISIGIFASSISANQVLSFIIALAISSAFYLIRFIADFMPFRLIRFVEYFGFDYHLQNFLRGVIDSRDILFFAAVMVIFNLLAELNLQSHNMMQER
ncbi:MAG: ABC transporter permease subunit [Candidatus Cloacimonadaceae bacterium]|nr:ABC transporter permease subunit [Candidatus Cloacimonadaceae bacterium]